MRILTERGYFKEKEESYQREYNQTIENEFNRMIKLNDDEFEKLSKEIKNIILSIEYSDDYETKNKERKANAARIDAFRTVETIRDHIYPIISNKNLSDEHLENEVRVSERSSNWSTHSDFAKKKINTILSKTKKDTIGIKLPESRGKIKI